MARRILLADDSVTAQNMGRRILSDAGYEVITVNNGSAALKKVSEQPPDVIVLDVYMPGYGGLEVCQRLKEVSETARIPILLTVGKLEPFKPDEARRVRADAFIVKPFEATELLAALTKLEDKIVPQSDSPKSGKVRSIATEPGRNEGDTGWKNRLIIPPGGKGRSPEGMEADDFGQGAKSEVAKDAPKEVHKESAKEVEKVAAEEAPKPVLVTEEKPAAVAEEIKKPEEVTQAPAANVQEIRASEAKPAEVAQESKEKETEKETAAAAQAESVAPSAPEKFETPAIAEAAPAATASKGPRWVAETVALSADDTALPLEKEMEKSLAAVAALKAGLEAAEAVPVVSEQAVAEPAKAESQSAVASETVTTAAETKTSESSEVKAPESAAAATVSSDAESKPVEAVAEVAAPAKPEAYAAAASMGATASESGTTEMRPAATTANSGEDTSAAEVASGNKQQLADAWEKWQNVRETVLNSPVAEQITEVAAASLKNAAELPGESMAHASNPTNIANIVDSVLAELKPKLVEEIAKKLGKDKK